MILLSPCHIVNSRFHCNSNFCLGQENFSETIFRRKVHESENYCDSSTGCLRAGFEELELNCCDSYDFSEKMEP